VWKRSVLEIISFMVDQGIDHTFQDPTFIASIRPVPLLLKIAIMPNPT
jgi:hypothetical protein